MTVVSVVILALWLGGQPWLKWPGLPSDVSHRLTLLACAVALGMTQLATTRRHYALPRAWLCGVLSLVTVMLVQQWPVMRDAAYFEWFQETAAFSDGLLVLLGVTWGLWALRQLPRVWFRRLRWVGLALLLVNLGVAACHAAQWDVPGIPTLWAVSNNARSERIVPTGLLGVNRCLAVYAIAWTPLLVADLRTPWRWGLLMVPLAIVWLAGTITGWLGVALVAWWMIPHRAIRTVAVGLAVVAALWLTHGELPKKIPMRLTTWQHVGQAITAKPWTGWGFHPMTVTEVPKRYGTVLPGFHSDWLLLAFHAGVPILLGLAWLVVQMVRTPARTPWAHALQGSVLALSSMAGVQAVLSHARITGLVIVFLAWWLVEQQGVSHA